jgi:hypothetical protein
VLLDQQSLGRAWVRPDVVERLIDQHVDGVVDHSDRLWSLLVLELWADSSVGSPPERPAFSENARQEVAAK